MKRILMISLLMTVACGSDSSKHFPTYIDVNNLRIFARDGVSTTFLNNVGKAYEAMFAEGADIDSSMRSTYLTTCKDKMPPQSPGQQNTDHDGEYGGNGDNLLNIPNECQQGQSNDARTKTDQPLGKGCEKDRQRCKCKFQIPISLLSPEPHSAAAFETNHDLRARSIRSQPTHHRCRT